MKKFRKLLAGFMAALTLAALPSPALAADSSQKALRLQDLDFLVTSLEQNHPNMYANTTREAISAKKADIEKNLDTLDDFGFALELQSLVSMLGDSHTSVSTNSADDYRILNFSPMWFDGKWVLGSVSKAEEAYLGQELVAINNIPLEDVIAKITPFISHDNDIKLRRQVSQCMYVWDILAHFGVVQASQESTSLTLKNSDGMLSTLTLKPQTSDEYKTSETARLKSLRTAIPVTEVDKNVNYKMISLAADTLYIQYNACLEDKNLPMNTFAEQVSAELALGTTGRIIVDFRNNGGGSDGVIWAMLEDIIGEMQRGVQVYALIGESTFSSAIINAVQMKQLGATLAGSGTSGSVSHFGAVKTFELPNSKLRVNYSTKMIDLGAYYAAAKPFGIAPLTPDIEIEQTLEDYLAGIDSAISKIMKSPTISPATSAAATQSSSVISVDGKETPLNAYIIGDEHYVKLRDMATILADTPKHFNVTWNSQAVYVDIGKSYTPVGGELSAIGAQTAAAFPAKTTLVSNKMPFALAGAPGGLQVYRIADYHYLKLRDIAAKMDFGINWNGKNVSISTDQNYDM